MRLLFVPLLFLLIVSFQNCGKYQAIDASGDSPLRSSDCDEQSFVYFESTFYQKFREVGCNNCHSQSNLLNFVAEDARVAYSNFSERASSDFINKISLESHQQSVLNYDKSALVEALTLYTSELKSMKQTCDPLSDLAHTTAVKTAGFFDGPGGDSDTRCGFNDPILVENILAPYSTDQPKTDTLEWDLGAEDSRLAGVLVRIDVSPEKPQGFPIGSPNYACPNQDGYQVGALRFVSTINRINLKNVSVILNGSDQENLHHFGVDLELGPGDGEVYMLSGSGGFTIYTMVGQPILKSDTWQIQIETIKTID